MYPPYFVMPIFGIRVGVHHHVGSFCVPAASLSGGKERQGLYMRKFKTAEKNRTNYVYYTAEGKKVELVRNTDNYTVKVVGADAGYLISDVNG